MNADTLLTKLQDASDGGPLDRLAQLAVDALLDRPVSSLVGQVDAPALVRAALEGWLASPTALAVLTRRVEAAVNTLAKDGRTLKDATPAALRTVARQLTGRAWSPDKKVVLTIIDREPMRELVRAILLTTVLDFGRKASAPVAGVAKGLGSLARFGMEQVKSRSGGLGSLVGAVGEEVERQLEKRAVEFVDAALAGVFSQLADSVADPKRAAEAAELRTELFDGAMALTLKQVSRELMNADVTGGAEVLRQGLTKWLSTPEATEQLKQAVARLLEHDGARPAKEVLAEVGLLEVARAYGTKWMKARFSDVTATPAFAEWLKATAGA